MKKPLYGANPNMPKLQKEPESYQRIFPLATDSELNESRGIPANLDQTFNDLIHLAIEWQSTEESQDSVDRDQLARKAFSMAGELIGPLIGWAINHESGKALVALRSYVSTSPHRYKSSQSAAKVEENNRALNSTENERRGVAYKSRDPIINRNLVGKFLFFLSEGMNFVPGQIVGAALGQLDTGSVSDTLKPGKVKRKPLSAKIDGARHQAILHMEFRRGEGAKKVDAIKIVALAFGVGVDTLEIWKKKSAERLTSIDQGYFIDSCHHAFILGQKFAALNNAPKLAKLVPFYPSINFYDKATRLLILEKASQYSDTGLGSDGKKYRALQKRAAELGPK